MSRSNNNHQIEQTRLQLWQLWETAEEECKQKNQQANPPAATTGDFGHPMTVHLNPVTSVIRDFYRQFPLLSTLAPVAKD